MKVLSVLAKEVVMADLSKQEVQALGRAVGLNIQDPELIEVAYSLSAILELMAEIEPPGENAVEPLPIILPQGLALQADACSREV
jgi:hypothetical protein